MSRRDRKSRFSICVGHVKSRAVLLKKGSDEALDGLLSKWLPGTAVGVLGYRKGV